MGTDPAQMDFLAKQVQDALQTADLDGYRELLDPKVTWGGADDTTSGCHTRDQVLAWYRQGRANGVAAEVTESVVHGEQILVGLRVHGSGEALESGSPVDRWQVLTVRAGLVIDIRGFDDRTSVLHHLG